MVDSKEETIALDDETKENETSAYYPHFSTEDKEVVKSLSPDENNPLEIPEESATNAVFYQQYNEATIGKSEDTVSEPIQDSDFNDPSHMSNTIIPNEESCNADTCIEKNNSADIKENRKEVLSELQECLHGNKQSDDITFCRSNHMAETLYEKFPQQNKLPYLMSSHPEMCVGLQEIPNITSDQTEEQLKKEEIFCDPCLHGDIKSKATLFCKTCDVPEPLCADCGVQHTRHKLCRNHELCDNMAELSITRVPFKPKENESKQSEFFCDSCVFENIKSKATHFCKTCEDPEPLCNKCAQQHLRHNLCRNHEICDAIEELHDIKVAVKEKENQCKQLEVLCESCLFGNLNIRATHFCKTCEDPEPLCNSCAQLHIRHKLCRDHEICDVIEELLDKKIAIIQKENESKQSEFFCDSCVFENIKFKATHFCKTCEDPEPLCNKCAQQHLRHNLCRNHEICDAIEELHDKKVAVKETENQYKQLEVLCESCLFGNLNIRATHFCKTCEDPEPLCNSCAQLHIRHNLCRDHEICDVIEELLDKKKKSQSKETEVWCEPCRFGDLNTKATHFCKTCEDLEPLCEKCAQQHVRHKLCRGHEICNGIEEFVDMKEALDKKENQYKKTEVWCEPCRFGNLNTKATHFCKTCEDLEPLCENCAQQHVRHKLCRGHEIYNGIEEFLDMKESNQNESQSKLSEILRDPCLFENLNTKATHFCKTCEDLEPLCDKCAQEHKRHKLCRDHELCDTLEEFINSQVSMRKKGSQMEHLDIYCNPCRNGDLIKKATLFCKTCNVPEPLCKDCAAQHIRHKLCRNHKLCDDMDEFPNVQRASNQKNSAEILKKIDDKSPGKPYAEEIKSDSVRLFWNKSNQPADHYQIRFKAKNGNLKWKFTDTDSDENNVNISGLMAHTKYIFQVRGIFGEQEGPYGQANEDIETKKSSATTLLGFSFLQNNTDCPPKYLLPIQENKNARNSSARTRQLTLGQPLKDFCEEKTIMLVGATGSGKSTLVDGIVNYIMGVSFDDPFRFRIVTLEEEEKKSHNQAISQTEWITVYKIYPTEGSRLKYTLNIIDTPGFGDTRGIERDHAIIDQIRHLFSAQGDQGVMFIDAVCFIVKAPDARLTVVQKYIFSSVMSLFGKDIESNICTLITFADGAKPPVLASLNESKLPFGLTFNFNNSALFAENKGLTHNTLSPTFWEMGCSSFERFFRRIQKLETRSLCQTKNVLDEREQLKTVISNIQPQVSAGLSKLSELQQQLDIFKRYKNEIKDNQNFEYVVDEIKQEKIDLPKGQHVTNCIQCNVTCHEDCRIVDDENKRRCWAMDKRTGCCRICSGKCIWSDHKNTPYIFKYVTETVKKTYAEMKQRYEAAQGQTLTHEKYIEELTYDVDELFDIITAMMNEMNDCKTRLKEIALRPDPLTAVEHIDLMIQSEEIDKQPGFLKRVQMLKEI